MQRNQSMVVIKCILKMAIIAYLVKFSPNLLNTAIKKQKYRSLEKKTVKNY